MVDVERIRHALAQAQAFGETHVRLVVERPGKVTSKSTVRLAGRSGPISDREREVERVDERHVAAWFDVTSLRLWLARQRISSDSI